MLSSDNKIMSTAIMKQPAFDFIATETANSYDSYRIYELLINFRFNKLLCGGQKIWVLHNHLALKF